MQGNESESQDHESHRSRVEPRSTANVRRNRRDQGEFQHENRDDEDARRDTKEGGDAKTVEPIDGSIRGCEHALPFRLVRTDERCFGEPSLQAEEQVDTCLVTGGEADLPRRLLCPVSVNEGEGEVPAPVLQVPGMIPKVNLGKLVGPDMKRVAVEFSNCYGILLDEEVESLAREGEAIKYSCYGLNGDYRL